MASPVRSLRQRLDNMCLRGGNLSHGGLGIGRAAPLFRMEVDASGWVPWDGPERPSFPLQIVLPPGSGTAMAAMRTAFQEASLKDEMGPEGR